MYKALHPEDLDATEENISNVTIQNILLDQSYNDLGFQVGTRLVVLVEAQSTWTVNIVLRSLMYLLRPGRNIFKIQARTFMGAKRWSFPDQSCMSSIQATEKPVRNICVFPMNFRVEATNR